MIGSTDRMLKHWYENIIFLSFSCRVGKKRGFFSCAEIGHWGIISGTMEQVRNRLTFLEKEIFSFHYYRYPMCFIFNIHRVVFVLISELFAEFLGQPEASLKSFHVLVFCVFYNVSLHFTFFLYLESWIKNLKFRVSYSVFFGLTTVPVSRSLFRGQVFFQLWYKS